MQCLDRLRAAGEENCWLSLGRSLGGGENTLNKRLNWTNISCDGDLDSRLLYVPGFHGQNGEESVRFGELRITMNTMNCHYAICRWCGSVSFVRSWPSVSLVMVDFSPLALSELLLQIKECLRVLCTNEAKAAKCVEVTLASDQDQSFSYGAVQLVRRCGVDPEHAGEMRYLSWPGIPQEELDIVGRRDVQTTMTSLQPKKPVSA